MGEKYYEPSGKTLKDRLEEGGIKDEFFQSKLKNLEAYEIYRVVHIQTSRLDLCVRYLNPDGTERGGEASIIDIFSHQRDPHLIKTGKQ